MNVLRIVIASLAIGMLFTCTAVATDFEFTANGGASGNWNADINWDDGFGGNGTPTANDTATIPNGKTCIVPSSYTARAEIVTVEAGGELQVVDTLHIGENASANTTVLVVESGAVLDSNGDIHLYDHATINGDWAKGEVTIYKDLTLSGSGEINGEADILADSTETLTIASGLTLRNTGRMNIDLVNNGDIICDDSASNVSLMADVSGSGTYTSENDCALIIDPGGKLIGDDGTWYLDGGLLDFRGQTASFSDTLIFTSGVFNPQKDFTHYGNFILSEGNLDIDVEVPSGGTTTCVQLGLAP